jgi:hypothetical protein
MSKPIIWELDFINPKPDGDGITTVDPNNP